MTIYNNFSKLHTAYMIVQSQVWIYLAGGIFSSSLRYLATTTATPLFIHSSATHSSSWSSVSRDDEGWMSWRWMAGLNDSPHTHRPEILQTQNEKSLLYSGTSLIQTLLGQKEASLLVRRPNFRGWNMHTQGVKDTLHPPLLTPVRAVSSSRPLP